MKLKNILLTGLVLTSLTACNDFLDIDAPSKQTNESIFTKESEISLALNDVYVQLFSNDTFGQAFFTSLTMNSDVDFATNSSEVATETGYARFECTSQGSGIKKAWDALYKGLEVANNFIYNLENSDIYSTDNEELTQMMGEAKCMRAMFASELIWYFGDVPFTFTPTYYRGDVNTPLPVVSRDEILDMVINDLKEIAPLMQPASEVTVERCSQDFAYAMIARLALQAGGYSLRPDQSNATRGTMQRPNNYTAYYQTAREYTKKVIDAGGHSLTKPYRQVFIDECNFRVTNNDDPIFEIPFAYKATGSVGYSHGPSCDLYEGSTTGLNTWGEAKGNARLNAFYRFTFDSLDVRRDYVNGLWYYLYDGTATMRADYTVHNNKWSKFWSNVNTDAQSQSNTGINFPYMRYADVLLMFAEADNEINNGPSSEAKEAVKAVRRRAFAGSTAQGDKVDAYVNAAGTKEEFLNLVLNERKWEFAGENMRWKDLVRNNKYSEVLYWTFLRYIAVAEDAGSGSDYMDAVCAYDGCPNGMELPTTMHYNRISNPGNTDIYPNTTLEIFDIMNPYNSSTQYTGYSLHQDFYAWWNDNASAPRPQCLYSLYGFARGDEQGRLYLVNNSGSLIDLPFPVTDYSQLPVVRYILPYPNNAIQRAAGAYKNYYGYAN